MSERVVAWGYQWRFKRPGNDDWWRWGTQLCTTREQAEQLAKPRTNYETRVVALAALTQEEE